MRLLEISVKQTLNLLEGDSLLYASTDIRDLRNIYPAVAKSKEIEYVLFLTTNAILAFFVYTQSSFHPFQGFCRKPR